MRHRLTEGNVGEDRGASEQKIPDGGVTNRSGALFTRPSGVRVSIERFD